MGILNRYKDSKVRLLIEMIIIGFLSALFLSFVIIRSEDVLYVTKMISYQKTLLILIIFSFFSYLILEYTIKSTNLVNDKENFNHVIRMIRFLLINSLVGYTIIILYYNLDSLLGYTVVKDRMEMNVLGVVIFSFIIPLAQFLSHNYGKKAQMVVSVQLVFVFLIVMQRIFNGAIIVEFSALAYLFVPTVFLLRIKKLYISAAYAGSMAGLFYYLYIILNGGNTYHTLVDYKVYLSMFSHGTLLMVSLIYMSRIKFATKELIFVGGYLLFALFWAIFNRPETNEFKFFIYDIIDGEMLHAFSNNLTSMHYIIYYILLTLFLLFSMRVFLGINKRYTKKTLEPID